MEGTAKRPDSTTRSDRADGSSDFNHDPIRTHPCFLNVVLLETNPDKIVPLGEHAAERIHRIRETRLGDLRIRWSERAKVPNPGKLEDYHYRPRLYVMSGTFDLSAVFLSSSLELSAWMQDGGLMAAGQDINVALLPTMESMGLGETKPKVDFNQAFLDRFKTSFRSSEEMSPEVKRSVEPDLSFVSAIKVKLSPLTIWPEPKLPAALESGVSQGVVASLWRVIEDWRASTKVLAADGRKVVPQVAMGLSFGWSELLVVAYSDSPGKLLELSVRLRSPMAKIEATDHVLRYRRSRSHAVLTTITTLGHDFEVRRQAQAWMERLEAETAERETTLEGVEPAPFPAREILKATKSITRGCPKDALDESDGEPAHTYLQLGFHAYPGHEWRLLELLTDLETTLGGAVWRLAGSAKDGEPLSHSMLCIDSGKRDLWTPMIKIGKSGLVPLEAAALGDLIQVWIRNGGRGPKDKPSAKEEALPGPTRRIPDAFDFYTRISCLSEGFLRRFPKDIRLEEHVTHLPSEILAGENLKYRLRFRRSEHPSGNSASVRLRDVRLTQSIKEALRVLQLPYTLSEQILHVVNMLLWAHDREIVWDESVELVPPVLALAQYLGERRGWWLNERERLSGLKPFLSDRHRDLWERELENVSRQLKDSPDQDLIRLNRAFRTYFYNVHFSSYMTDEMPDLNLRYKGSVHQLLRIANLILDALTDIVLGPRACMAIIDDRISPEVRMPCQVTVVQLNSSAFTTPFMLETLAHEVAHQLLISLDRWKPSPETQEALFSGGSRRIDLAKLAAEINPWIDAKGGPEVRGTSLGQVARSFSLLKHELFLELIDESSDDATALFVESAADFLEMQLLQGGVRKESSEERFKDWAQRFLLRASLAATATSIDLSPEGETSIHDAAPQIDPPKVRDTPAANNKEISSALTRVVVVFVIWTLLKWKEHHSDGIEISESFTVDWFRTELLKGLDVEEAGNNSHDELTLGSLLDFLREDCITGPNSRLRRNVLCSRLKWGEWIRHEVIDLIVWFRDQQGFSLATEFYTALENLAGWMDVEQNSTPRGEAGYQGTGRLWPSIRDAFREFWHDPLMDADPEEPGTPTTMKNILLPSLYVRHWLDRKTRDELRRSAKGGNDDDPANKELYRRARPLWRAEIQPLSKAEVPQSQKGQLDPADEIDAQTVIFQRGGFRPATKAARAIWDSASRRFLVRMLWMVPAWHRAVLYKIENIFDSLDKAGEDEDNDRSSQRHAD